MAANKRVNKMQRPTTNDPRPNDKKTTVSLSLSPDVLHRLRLLADADERAVSWMAQKLLEEAIHARELLKINTSR